jgi:hypothetical protein
MPKRREQGACPGTLAHETDDANASRNAVASSEENQLPAPDRGGSERCFVQTVYDGASKSRSSSEKVET